MPARLSGLLDWSGGILRDGKAEAAWAAAYPASPPWHRTARHVGEGLMVVDVCGESSLSRCFAVDPKARAGVAGTIRLDDPDVLRAELAAEPAGDAGLILAAYLRWGTAAFSRLAGDFSFVLWDEPAQTGYLVRDPFGVRRLHYAVYRGGLVFSTDVEGVLAWPGLDRSPDEVTVLDNLLGRYRTREGTFFHAIKRVTPGHHLVVRRDDRRLVRHLEIPRRGPDFRSLEEYAEAFRFELARSVKQRLPASGPLACHVSGGLDSLSMATLARSELERQGRPRDLALVCARFAGWPTDEGFVAHELSRRLKVPLQEWDGRVPETSDLERPRLAWPFGRSSMAGAWQGDLALAERYGASILFSGSGGNQMATEASYFRDAWRAGGLPEYLRAVVTVGGTLSRRWSLYRLRYTFAQARGVIPTALFAKSVPPVVERSSPAWFGPRLRAAWTMLPEIPPPAVAPKTGGWMADAIWAEAVDDPGHVWTLEHEDARATEKGLEFRFPYLSWGLLSLVLSIPWSLRFPTEIGRRLQRLAMRGVLPDWLRLRDTFLDFSESVMLNTQAATGSIENLLVSGPWASEGLVDRAIALDTLRRLSTSAGRVFTYEEGEAWRAIRDVAALEAWLRQL